MPVSHTVSTRALTGVIQPVRIGFVPLADCAPLLVAEETGMFRRHGVMVKLSCEVGWATVREKLLYRQLDAAHAIAGLALAMRMGIGCPQMAVVAPLVFNLHGNAITLSRDLWNRGVRDAQTLHKLLRSSPGRVLTLGVVSRFSSHAFLVRQWLASGGIVNNDRVRTVVLPPTQMASSLEAGLIDGFCVGEPWNSVAVDSGAGWIVSTSEQLAPNHPEKVLLTSERFIEEHSDQAAAIVAALREACAFCDASENRPEVVRILSDSSYFPECDHALHHSLVGPLDLGTGEAADASHFHIFQRHEANVPTKERGSWLVQQFVCQGLITPQQRQTAESALNDCWKALSDAQPAKNVRPQKNPVRKQTSTLVSA